jgi:hypothetical protein
LSFDNLEGSDNNDEAIEVRKCRKNKNSKISEIQEYHSSIDGSNHEESELNHKGGDEKRRFK